MSAKRPEKRRPSAPSPSSSSSSSGREREAFRRRVVQERIQRADDMALKNIFIQLGMSILAIVLVYIGVAMLRWGVDKDLVNERNVECPPCH